VSRLWSGSDSPMGALLARIGRDESGEMPAVVTADGARASGSLGRRKPKNFIEALQQSAPAITFW